MSRRRSVSAAAEWPSRTGRGRDGTDAWRRDPVERTPAEDELCLEPGSERRRASPASRVTGGSRPDGRRHPRSDAAETPRAFRHRTERKEIGMKPSLLYRIASLLLVLFSVGHTVGFRQTKGMMGADTVVALMQSVRFPVQGFQRTYWDFYVGFGLFVTLFLLFSAGLSWALAGTPQDVRRQMPAATWGLAICFLGVAILSWCYFFVAPGVFATLITVCLGIDRKSTRL